VNICFASLNYPLNGHATSGVGSQVRSLAHSLVQAGHSVSVVDLALNGQDSIVEDRGVQVYRVRSGNLHWFAGKLPLVGKLLALPMREIEYSMALWRGIRRAERSHEINLIEGTETGALLPSLFCRRVPLVIRLHGERYTFHKYTPRLTMTLDIRLSRLLQRFAFRRARLLISPSQAHAREVAQELHSDIESIRVIPNCVDLTEIPSSTNGPRDESTVLYVGRIEQVKGIPLLLEAAQLVVQECPSTRFILAGSSHPTLPREDIAAMISRYSLQNHVEQLGHVSQQELISLYRRASLCVVPSHYESFGLVALEAMACGVAVVATQTGGLPEVIEDGSTGLLVPPGDASALAGAICELLGDPRKRSRMGEAGSARARGKYSIKQNTLLNISMYEGIVARPGAFDRLNYIPSELS
jgi:glycosyltransferase involved in cell wall biosynthesis